MHFEALAHHIEDENICHKQRSKLLFQVWYLFSGINNQNEELCLGARVVWDTRTGAGQAGTNLQTPGYSWAPSAACGERR